MWANLFRYAKDSGTSYFLAHPKAPTFTKKHKKNNFERGLHVAKERVYK